MSTFTTLYVTKSLIGRPAATTNAARHKQFNGKLLKEENSDLNQTLFNLVQPNESLVYHPFNASEFDLQLLKSRNSERARKTGADAEHQANATNSLSTRKTGQIKSHQINHKNQKEFKGLEEESLKGLKRAKRSNLRYDLVLAELGLAGSQQADLISDADRPKKRVRRWNEVLWTKPKPQQQTPWLPLTKKLARQPRNSLHKLFIVRPTKKVYKSPSKDFKLARDPPLTARNLTKNRQINQINHNFNQPSDLLHFAINDVIAGGKQQATETTPGRLDTVMDTTNYEQRDSDKRSDEFLHQSAASSPSPTYVNFSMEPSFAGFDTTYQPKVYNLRTNHHSSLTEQQLLKRNSATNPSNPFAGQTSQPSYRTNAASSHLASDSFPIATTDKNETGNLQRVALLNPFHTPSFLMESKNAKVDANAMHPSDSSRTQARSKGARKLELNASRKDWEKEVLEIPMDDWNTEEHDFTAKNGLRQVS